VLEIGRGNLEIAASPAGIEQATATMSGKGYVFARSDALLVSPSTALKQA
jgi:hypothetical protein